MSINLCLAGVLRYVLLRGQGRFGGLLRMRGLVSVSLVETQKVEYVH